MNGCFLLNKKINILPRVLKICAARYINGLFYKNINFESPNAPSYWQCISKLTQEQRLGSWYLVQSLLNTYNTAHIV